MPAKPPAAPRLVKSMATPEDRKFWQSVERASKEVDAWPEWKKGRLFDAALLAEPNTKDAKVRKRAGN